MKKSTQFALLAGATMLASVSLSYGQSSGSQRNLSQLPDGQRPRVVPTGRGPLAQPVPPATSTTVTPQQQNTRTNPSSSPFGTR